jgi:hypothetical protein
MDAFCISSYTMHGKRANRLQNSIRPVLFAKKMVRALMNTIKRDKGYA